MREVKARKGLQRHIWMDGFINPYSTNRCTIIISCISLLISSYMFQHNCHHQAADTCIATNCSNAIFLHC